MLPSIYEHWGITLTVIGAGYILLALLCCRLLGFNHTTAGMGRATPRPDNSPLPKPTTDSATTQAPPPAAAVRPDCRAEELLYTTAYVECLTEDSEGCPHRLGYGQASFCHHPQRDKIVARTDTTTD